MRLLAAPVPPAYLADRIIARLRARRRRVRLRLRRRNCRRGRDGASGRLVYLSRIESADARGPACCR